MVELADKRGIRMIPQAPCVDSRRHKIVAQCVHHHQRCQPCGIAEIIPELAFCECRTGCRLNSDYPELFAVNLVLQKREAYTPQITSAAAASDDNVGIIPHHSKLLFCL